MLRHYYVSEDLNDLEQLEQELKNNGVTAHQIHCLSEDDAAVDVRHLNAIESVLKKDVVHSTEIGALIGVVLSSAVLGLSYMMGWTQSAAGWLPFVFLAIAVLGFCTWEGCLIGIQRPHFQFKRFQRLLKQGKHVFFVDVDPNQEPILSAAAAGHPNLENAGTGPATPRWVVRSQDTFDRFMKAMP